MHFTVTIPGKWGFQLRSQWFEIRLVLQVDYHPALLMGTLYIYGVSQCAM